MKSLHALAKKAGLTQSPLSVQALATKYNLPFPVSVIDLVRWMDQIIFSVDSMKVGDVSGSAALALVSNGVFSLKVDLKDDGDWYGDNFKFEMTFGDGFSVYMQAHIDAGDEFHKQSDGQDPNIVGHWDIIRSSKHDWDLNVDPAVGGDEWAGVIAKVVGIAGLAVLLVIGVSKTKWTQDENGNIVIHADGGSY